MEFQISFRPFKSEDALFVNKLRQIEKMEELIGGAKRPVALERDVKWVQDIMMGDNQHMIYYAVTLQNDDAMIGYLSISDIDFRNGTCSFSGIKIDPTHSGKGLGTEVVLKSMKYVFEELRMERCVALCFDDNHASLKMFEKAGFKREGLMRNSIFKNGRHISQWMVSMIKEEYAAIKKDLDL